MRVIIYTILDSPITIFFYCYLTKSTVLKYHIQVYKKIKIDGKSCKCPIFVVKTKLPSGINTNTLSLFKKIMQSSRDAFLNVLTKLHFLKKILLEHFRFYIRSGGIPSN